MKKNNVMRVFALMLALTLISVCAISGTFAKYVTKVEGQDHARVAKWGVLLNIEGNAFASEYEATDDKYLAAGGTVSVRAEEEEDVVAPGTNSDQVGKTLKASVTGRPEVAARYAVVISDVADIVLPAGTYTDYTELVKDATTGEYGYKTFTLDKDYAPVKWNLTIDKNGANTISVADKIYEELAGTQYLAAAEAYGLTASGCSIFDAVKILKKVADSATYKQVVNNALQGIVHDGRNFQLEVDDQTGALTLSYDFDPNKEMGFNFELTWEWAFEGNDKADTYLGNYIAGVLGNDNVEQPTAGEVSVNINATLTATATQID